MTVAVTRYRPERWPLAARRTALLARIQAARVGTAQAGRRVAADLHATERSRRAFLTGFKIFKATLVASGVIWSLNAPSRIGRGSRLLTIAIGLFSTIRAMRRVGALLGSLTQLPRGQG